MKKLLLFCTLFMTLCSIGQTINITTGLAIVGQTDANWKFGATTPGTNAPYIVNALPSWQSTPISVTNAKWISPHMDGGLGQIDYIYDFAFTVQPNRNRLDYNFKIAASD